MSPHDRDVDDVTGVETTGHEWDGIKELNNPLPRWWLWIFYASIVWSVVYMVFMPAIPGLPGMAGATPGLRGESERINVREDMAALEASRKPFYEKLAGAPLDTVEGDPELLQFALAAGESAFGVNCSPCHGSGAQGFKGYPNLNDDAWIWGGTLAEIRHTIAHGIRNDLSEWPETRFSLMPAYGADGILSAREISDLAQYVLRLGGNDADAAAAARAAETFETQCAACHGLDGKGDHAQGAPNLTDADWLYGGTPEEIAATIHRGPAGKMPPWQGRLDEATIDALAVYVHTLGGGEPS